jgi:hypothetical protein
MEDGFYWFVGETIYNEDKPPTRRAYDEPCEVHTVPNGTRYVRFFEHHRPSMASLLACHGVFIPLTRPEVISFQIGV